ncbi:MAG: protein translocase subunit SecF [Rhodobacterales bacterium]|nr:protein translocase subunit SecF [Rhodobacterales bacterium]
MRLKLVPKNTSWDFFSRSKLWIGISIVLVFLSLLSFFIQSLNFGIDFRGGTSIRTESSEPVDVADYRSALSSLDLGDITISEVFDPNFADDQNVAMIRIQAQPGQEAATSTLVENSLQKLREVSEDIRFVSVESVGPKVSGELIKTAIIAVILAISAVLFYIWIRFEWQFAIGAISALIHDVILTIGIFSALQIKFDLAIIAAILTIVGYSLNDTVVVFDRVRENLRKFKKRSLVEVMNLSINETMSRTVMTSVTTLLALISLFILGGDVIRGFVFAMIWGVVVGTYSSIFIASAILLWTGVKRDWSKPNAEAGTQVPQ